MIRYLFFILFGLPFFVFSQNSLKVEIEYLKLLSVQNNSELIADNYRNAELVADSIIFAKSDNKQIAEFFLQLAKSYSLNKNYENQAFSILRQQFLFKNKNYDLPAKDLFLDACFKLNIEKEYALNILELKNKQTQDFNNNFLLFIEAAIKLNKKNLNKNILKYISFYKTISNNYPFWLHQWEFFTTISVKQKNMLSFINFDKQNTDKSLINFIPEKQQKYVILKAEKYFRKNKAIKQAKFYLQKYKSYDLSFFEKIKALNRKILILTPVI